ncbi:hypothetical protein MMAS_09600 [Mycobacteroides abscessus subsp. massiliense CCUG 48898 = JCM 15300]|nr:hypothetical protein MMAS_09600 [Mycobacteroides abscessus subsp. massiliense CCUG 48898 = JCM 15300]
MCDWATGNGGRQLVVEGQEQPIAHNRLVDRLTPCRQRVPGSFIKHLIDLQFFKVRTLHPACHFTPPAELMYAQSIHHT